MDNERRPHPLLRALALAVPLLLGVCGLMASGERLLDALFAGVAMYALNYQDPPPNLLVELARWSAPLATASGVFLAFGAAPRRLQAAWRYRRGGSVAVYGPEEGRAPLLAALGPRGIDGGEAPSGRLLPAGRYILLGDERESLALYTRCQPQLAGHEVFVRCSSLPAQAAAPAGLHLFCPEETAARLYWKEHPLYPLSAERGHRLQIVLLGFGRLGEELLTRGLQNNIFAPGQCIAYHVFGDTALFAAAHTELGRIGDPVRFHPEPWYESLALLEQADLVLVAEQQAQTALLQQLLFATRRARFTVFAADPALAGLLDGQQRLTLLDWRAAAQSPEEILSDRLLDRAMRINLRYAHLYGGVEETEAALRQEWAKLDSFTRYSNISAADYHEVRCAMLAAQELPGSGAPLPADCLEQLAELEHIRWCRYHFLNNWQPGQPANGKAKDPALRLHTDLVPYAALSEPDKEKDRENIRILMALG